jgi:hypothetical protein
MEYMSVDSVQAQSNNDTDGPTNGPDASVHEHGERDGDDVDAEAQSASGSDSENAQETTQIDPSGSGTETVIETATETETKARANPNPNPNPKAEAEVETETDTKSGGAVDADEASLLLLGPDTPFPALLLQVPTEVCLKQTVPSLQEALGDQLQLFQDAVEEARVAAAARPHTSPDAHARMKRQRLHQNQHQHPLGSEVLVAGESADESRPGLVRPSSDQTARKSSGFVSASASALSAVSAVSAASAASAKVDG